MNIKYKFVSFSDDLSPRQNSLYLFIKKKYNISLYYSKKKKFISRFLDLLIKIIKYKLKKNHSSNFIIGNNSIFISLIIRFIFPRSYIITDIGYFANDIKELNFARKVIYWLSDIISLFLSDLILFETFAQRRRYSNNYFIGVFKRKFRVFYALNGEIKKFSSKLDKLVIKEFSYFNQSKIINILEDKYLLFRGKFNYESGVDLLAKIYTSLGESNLKKMPLIFLGNGPLMNNLVHNLNLVQKNKVILITDYLSISNLNLLIDNSSILFGQFNNDSLRLKYTLPNKFFEAMINKKPYITPNYSSFQYLHKLGIVKIYNKENISTSNSSKEVRHLFLNFVEKANLILNQNEEVVIIESNRDFLLDMQNLNDTNLEL